MNRTLLIVVGIAAVVIVGAIVFVVGSGDDDPDLEASDNVAGNMNDAGGADAGPSLPFPAEDTNALRALEDWAEALADGGIEISYDDTSVDGNRSIVRNLMVAAADGVAHWSVAEAAVQEIDGALVMQWSGEQTLAFVLGDESYSIASIGASTTISSSDDGRSVIILVNDVSAAAVNARWTAGTMRIEFRAGVEQPAKLLITDLALIETTRPFGPALSSVELRFGEDDTDENDGIVITGLALESGALVFDASGTIALRDGEFSGELEAQIHDILTALDVYHAYDRFDRDVLAMAYAALLADVANNPDGPYSFEATIDNGTLVLEGEQRNMPDLPLEGVLLFGELGTIQ